MVCVRFPYRDARSRKGIIVATKVAEPTYLPPADTMLLSMSSDELVDHGKNDDEKRVAAGLEFYRRAYNKRVKRAGDA